MNCGGPGRSGAEGRAETLLLRTSPSAWVRALALVCIGMAEDSTNAPASPATSVAPESASTNWNVGLTFGAGFGVAALGSTDAHDLAIATLHVGKLLESENRFFRHLELSGELWGGVGNGCRSSSRSRIQRGN